MTFDARPTVMFDVRRQNQTKYYTPLLSCGQIDFAWAHRPGNTVSQWTVSQLCRWTVFKMFLCRWTVLSSRLSHLIVFTGDSVTEANKTLDSLCPSSISFIALLSWNDKIPQLVTLTCLHQLQGLLFFILFSLSNNSDEGLGGVGVWYSLFIKKVSPIIHLIKILGYSLDQLFIKSKKGGKEFWLFTIH